MRKPEETRTRYTYKRVFSLEELGRAADVWRLGREWGHWSNRTRHVGPVAYVADQLGLPYGHAARLVWDAFEEGLLVVVPQWDDATGARIEDVEEVELQPLDIGDDIESLLVANYSEVEP